ncbi:ubiquitin-conjugating enzyme E2D 1 [Phycomyces nitens]|nr:ubiquitin-conjugating enzyme E2D 1 [Phycomyces nitens]
MALKRIQRELAEITRNPPEGISAFAMDEDLFHWRAIINGPPNSAYRGGVFYLTIVFSPEYPFKPPTIKFATKIYHPNIDNDGSICIDLLKADVWKPATKVYQVLLAIAYILEHPNPDDALVASVAEVYNTNQPKFIKLAQESVKKYATA